MVSFFQLFNLSSGNVVGEYESQPEALSDLQRMAEQYGVDQLVDYSLMELTDEDQTVVAMQDDLVRLVLSSQPEAAVDDLHSA